MAYSEALTGNGLGGTLYRGNGMMNYSGTGNDNFWIFDAQANPQSVLNQLQLCAAAFTVANSGNIVVRRGYRWQEGIPGFTMFNHLQVPNDSQYPVNYCRSGCNSGCNMDSNVSSPASSNHSGGVNACMADGSVKFIKSSINRMTWWALGTRGGGETISSDAY